MFTKKHMIEIADIVKDVESTNERTYLARRFAYMLGVSNPLFKREKFLSACGVITLPEKCTSNKG